MQGSAKGSHMRGEGEPMRRPALHTHYILYIYYYRRNRKIQGCYKIELILSIRRILDI